MHCTAWYSYGLLPAGQDHKHACLIFKDVGGSRENSGICQTAVKVSRDVPTCREELQVALKNLKDVQTIEVQLVRMTTWQHNYLELIYTQNQNIHFKNYF